LSTEARVTELQKLAESLQEKYDTTFNEQQGLEADLEAANDLIDRLRANVAESEKHNRNGARRYADQVGGESCITFDTNTSRRRRSRQSALSTRPSCSTCSSG
jgi:septal ring factor EnvC (AmiA/AmiB activator)